MSEHLQLDTDTGRVKSTSSSVGTETKPIDFSNVFVIGITGAGTVTESGETPLVLGHDYVDVTFDHEQADTDWKLTVCYVANEVDPAPLNIWPGMINIKTTTGFRVQLNGAPDSGNYTLNWGLAVGAAAAPSPDTTPPTVPGSFTALAI